MKMADEQTTPNGYQVFITFCPAEDGRPTRDKLKARHLASRLGNSGVRVYLKKDTAQTEEAAQAIREASVLILVGEKAENMLSSTVHADYNAFLESVTAEHKTRWRIALYLPYDGCFEMPQSLLEHRSFTYSEIDHLVQWVQEQLAKEPPKNCILDVDDDEESVNAEEAADSGNIGGKPVPACAEESVPEDDDWDAFVRAAQESAARHGRIMRRAADGEEELRDVTETDEDAGGSFPEPSAPSAPVVRPVPIGPVGPVMPSVPPARGGKDTRKDKPVRVKPEKINKVDFSVVAPEKVKPGSRALVDVLMYTKSQREIVQRVIEQSREKATEAARSAASVSVRQGSQVTVVLSSEDISLSEDSETLIWNGDALDFQFRFGVPEDYKKKQIEFSCRILFDGILISRLYFTVAINSAKTVPVRFTRKDSRRAFVSYSHRDKQRVVDQLSAIQQVAPKLRFWMDSQSMSAGDQWRHSIRSAIKAADVFLLFWSRSSRESEEVRKEWEYALRLEKGSKRGKNGARFISPVPLDDPADCPPPPELGDLHFGDPSFDAGVEHIEDVNFLVGKRGRLGNITFF